MWGCPEGGENKGQNVGYIKKRFDFLPYAVLDPTVHGKTKNLNISKPFFDPLQLVESYISVSDTVAMTILALRCIVKDHRHRNLQHSLRRPSISLARQQQPDGGFGNIYNTALTMQVRLFNLSFAQLVVVQIWRILSSSAPPSVPLFDSHASYNYSR